MGAWTKHETQLWVRRPGATGSPLWKAQVAVGKGAIERRFPDKQVAKEMESGANLKPVVQGREVCDYPAEPDYSDP